MAQVVERFLEEAFKFKPQYLQEKKKWACVEKLLEVQYGANAQGNSQSA